MLSWPFGRKNQPGRRLQRQRTENNSTSGVAGRKHRPDYILLLPCILLTGIGLIVVYSISPGLASVRNVGENYFVGKQLTAIGLGALAFAAFSFLPVRVLKSGRGVLLAITLLAVVLAQFIGEEINGASRWIQFGGMSFQVAELVKFALILWLSMFLVDRIRCGEMGDTGKALKPLLFVVGLIGGVVLILESDTGSSAVMLAIVGIMAFTAGLPLKKLGLILGIISIGMLLVVGTSQYRRERVSTFLNPTADCQSEGYQSCQALIAVGSGGMFGLGLGKSVQAYGYLPEAANDSIFAVLAEKFGFVGVSSVIGIYLILFARLRRIIQRSSDLFARFFVLGVLVWITSQAIINIGAMIGLLPLKGITLPMISYGGTSLVFVMAALGVVYQISRYTSFATVDNHSMEGEGSNDYNARRRRQRRPHYASASSR